MGPQILAKRKTEQSFYFSKQLRETMNIKLSNVGPGSYFHFSEFGKWKNLIYSLIIKNIIHSII